MTGYKQAGSNHTHQNIWIAGQRWALAFFAVFVTAAVSTSPNPVWAWDCTDGWTTAYDDVSGTGVASITHQCRQDERPCPPKAELQRRAVAAARVLALADAQAKYASSIYQSNETESGRVSTYASSAAGGEVYDIEYCTRINGDTTEVKLVGAKW